MRPSRRRVLEMGGGLAVALALPPAAARAADVVEIAMRGRGGGAHVWFDPIGLRIRPGQTIRWINRNKGNSHTATAYHPANFDRPRRMPQAAEPWDSGYLLPDESFSVTLGVEGVYDYYCIPHELAGMVGRIVVGEPPATGWMSGAGADGGVPEAALKAFPPVEAIMSQGAVRRA